MKDRFKYLNYEQAASIGRFAEVAATINATDKEKQAAIRLTADGFFFDITRRGEFDTLLALKFDKVPQYPATCVAVNFIERVLANKTVEEQPEEATQACDMPQTEGGEA